MPWVQGTSTQNELIFEDVDIASLAWQAEPFGLVDRTSPSYPEIAWTLPSQRDEILQVLCRFILSQFPTEGIPELLETVYEVYVNYVPSVMDLAIVEPVPVRKKAKKAGTRLPPPIVITPEE